MNKKKLLALFLAVQMLLLSAASCTKGGTTEETQKPASNPAQTGTADTASGETAAPAPADPYADRLNVSDELPERDYDGKDFRFLVDEKYAYQFYSEDDSGVGLDAVIYERNQRVQDRYDVKISYLDTLGMESQDYMCQFAQVGEHIAEVVAYEQYMGNTPTVYFCWANWMDIPHLNFDQPWWNKVAIENHIINDYVFNIAGDLSLTAMQMTWCLAFNQELMESWGYPAETLYNYVWNGEWTLDKLIEVTSEYWLDENGDGMKDHGDKFAFGSPISGINEETGETFCAYRTIPWITALGEVAITVGDDQRSMKNTLGTESMYQSMEKLVNFHNNTKGAYKYATETDFAEGRIGIYTAKFDIFYNALENTNFSAGVLPLPKADAAQENYITAPDTFFTMFGLPITLDPNDYEFVGIMMEVLNAESWKTVYPAYYEEALKGRFATDENMANMIELITDSRVYEYGILMGQFLANVKLPYMICYAISDNSTDLASKLAENAHFIDETIAEILTFFDIEDETGILGADYERPDNQFGT